MEHIIEIIKLMIPALAVIFITIFLIQKYLDNQTKNSGLQIKMERQKATLPLRLQAYERITLFLERIAPSSLTMRVYKSGMSAKLFHADLLKSIREEYEHNLSQQLYISTASWDLVKKAKEETIKLINISAQNMEEDASAIDLNNQIFKMLMSLEQTPSEIALSYLRQEVKQLF